MADILYDPYAGYNVHQRRSPSDVNADPRSPILHLEDGQDSDSRKDKLSFRGSNLLTLRVICISLHILLVLLHLALLIAWTHHFEHGIIVSPSRSTTISTTIIVASQFFISTYTVLLVVATQRLALYGILLRRQTLTATHDESTAWVGLGSALLVLWKQTHIAASVVGTSLITIYLVGISVLHISTPSLFNLQAFDQPNSTMISTRIGMPEIYFSGSRDQNPLLIWEAITPSLSYLAYVDPSNTIGVQNGTLFDVLGANNGTGTVAVGATSFNVSCGLVSNTTVLRNGTTWTATFYVDGFRIVFQLGTITASVLGNAGWNPTVPASNRHRIFYSVGHTYILDSYGNIGSRVPINPPMRDEEPYGVSNYSASDITIMGCTLSIVNQRALVDSKTKELVSAKPVVTKTSSEWVPWTILNEPIDLQLDTWGDMLSEMPLGKIPLNVHCMLRPPYCSYVDVGSQYVMDQLGLFPNHATNTTLHEFENALAKMTALMYWAAGNQDANTPSEKFLRTSLLGSLSITQLHGSALVSTRETRLNINIPSLVVGFSTSIILLITSYLFIRRLPGTTPAGVDSTGILHSMWMAYTHPQLQDRFLQVVQPTTDNLRTIGMIELQLADEQLPSTSGSNQSGYHSVPLSETLNSTQVTDDIQTSQL